MNQNDSAEQGDHTQPQTPLDQVAQEQTSGADQSQLTQQFQGLGQVAQRGVPVSPNTQLEQATIDDTWRAKYEKARNRSRILAGTTAAACVLAVGAGVWGVTKPSDSQAIDLASGQFPVGAQAGPGDPQGGPGGLGGPGQGGPGRMLANMFNSDGSVNTERVDEFQSRMPSGIDPTELVDRAQQSGVITEDQATKLKAALVSSSTSNSSLSKDTEDDEDGTEPT